MRISNTQFVSEQCGHSFGIADAVIPLYEADGCAAFFLGMVLGYICEKGGSIYQSILFHMMFNFWGTIISGILPTGNSTLFFVLYFATGVICTFSGLILFRFGTNRLAQKQAAPLYLENTGYDTFYPSN